MQQESTHNISVTWRGQNFVVEINSVTTLKELGQALQKLTNVQADTMRLIVPQSSTKSSKLLCPFSEEHSAFSLQEFAIFKGKSIKMMGVPEVEVNEVLQNAKANLRIAGFEEEDKRIRQRISDRPHNSLKLPQGPYVFCDFRTLHIPGIELNPPPSEALKRMHMLAADPGIVAIMNKHRWRVGIMTEMAPEGYVGVSPMCILGFNKNHGEEISLRLRTDDLKGFRKYESIKKTLLHELAHMVYSEHDANFYALDKQLNEEAARLDWTRSRSHTLSGVKYSDHYEEDFDINNNSNMSQKLGGNRVDQLANARASSVAAANRRLENMHLNLPSTSKVYQEPDPGNSESNNHDLPDQTDAVVNEEPRTENRNQVSDDEPDPDDCSANQNMFEPDPDYTEGSEAMELDQHTDNGAGSEPGSDDIEMAHCDDRLTKLDRMNLSAEIDHNNLEVSLKCMVESDPHCSREMEKVDDDLQDVNAREEPHPDDGEAKQKKLAENIAQPDRDIVMVKDYVENQSKDYKEPSPVDFQKDRVGTAEPDPDDQELQRIQDPVAVICGRLQKAIKMLQAEVNPSEAATVLQTIFKIIRNVIENPDDIKFKRLRKANPTFQRTVANYKAAMEILFLIGFNEDVVLDEIGRGETYLVLKRNDPGLLWLVKSSLETCIAY